ncbi:hypothetical protein CIG75_02385 [Tumebacillus algifaecis]|uniref:Flagellar biosynthesis protein FlaG n=1 Tax=Tumebacillus algifaecis TaxID=1214604 RepID=A0A223CX46_9BACL|nr:flagellar protein FlaG [Tumebacillus algifaecis]ASS73939.1 hypothetical protein CIG75_02385 [Tumebacillus algifaecis]
MQIGRTNSLDQLLREPLSQNSDKAHVTSDVQSVVAQKEQEIDQKQTDQHVERLNRVLEQHQSQLMFRVRHEAGRAIVQLVEKEGDKVILQLPPEGLLELSKKVQQATGTVVDLRL